MKKSIKSLLLILLLCPLLVLTACVPPPTFLITASSSEPAWGRVNGSPNESLNEGTQITLGAIETSAQEHPFIGWIKDYSKFVSTETDLELVVNEENAGHYTALFDESANSMRFATLTGVKLNSTIYTGATFTVNYSVNVSGSSNYNLFTTGTIVTGETFVGDLTSIIYFGALGSNREYKFELLLELTSAEGAKSETIRFNDKLVNSTFNQTNTCEISTQFDETSSVTLSFQKLSKDMYKTAQPEEE